MRGLETIDFDAVRILASEQRNRMPQGAQASTLAVQEAAGATADSEAIAPSSGECLTQAEAEAEAAEQTSPATPSPVGEPATQQYEVFRNNL